MGDHEGRRRRKGRCAVFVGVKQKNNNMGEGCFCQIQHQFIDLVNLGIVSNFFALTVWDLIDQETQETRQTLIEKIEN